MVAAVLQFLLHHPDNRKRHTVHQHLLADGIFVTEQSLFEAIPQKGDPATQFDIEVIDHTAAAFRNEVAHLFIIGRTSADVFVDQVVPILELHPPPVVLAADLFDLGYSFLQIRDVVGK